MIDSARMLKKEVLTLLEDYASLINSNQHRAVRKKIPDDAKRINLKLEELLKILQK